MKQKSIYLTLSTMFLSASLFAQSIDFTGNLSTMWGVNAPGTENQGKFSIGDTDFTGKLEAFAGNGTARFEGNVKYNAVSNRLDFSLNEAYVDYSSSYWGIRLGQQKIVWGKADGIDITNSVFPEDSTSLYLDDSDLSVTAAKLSVTGNFFTIDALWIPLFRGTELPLDESNPLRSAILPSSVEFPGVGSVPVNLDSLSKPEFSLANGEYGLKMSGYFPLCDLSLYGFYGWDKTPLMNYTLNMTTPPVPDSVTVSGEYHRLAMVGADAAFPIGATVLRLEGAYFPERELQASSAYILNGGDSGIKQHQIMGLAGIDWMPDTWTITAQYYCDAVLNRSDDLNRTDAYTHGATLSISKTLLQETLELSLSGVVGFNCFDSAIEGAVTYSLTDQIKFVAGTYVFLPGPEKKGTYGKFKDLSSIYIKAQYCF